MTLGQRIKEARLERRMTQRELAGGRITRNMLSKIENGAATPSVRTLEYLAAAMGLPPGSFMSGASDPDGIPLRLLEQMLDRNDPAFSAKLASARENWEGTGLSLSLLEARFLLQSGAPQRALALLDTLRFREDSPRRFAALLLRGQTLLALGRPFDAEALLREAEALASEQGAAARARLFEALEFCYREQSDFQKAYYYAKMEK